MAQSERRPVVGYEGLYEVSESGEVYSLDRRITRPNGVSVYWKGRELKHIPDTRGYPMVGLSSGNRTKFFAVHRLVAIAFIPNPEGKATVNHKDANKLNAHYSNLEWATVQENIEHGRVNGLFERQRVITPPANFRPLKTHCPKGHEYTEDNTLYCYGRSKGVKHLSQKCRTCAKEQNRKYNAMRKTKGVLYE